MELYINQSRPSTVQSVHNIIFLFAFPGVTYIPNIYIYIYIQSLAAEVWRLGGPQTSTKGERDPSFFLSLLFFSLYKVFNTHSVLNAVTCALVFPFSFLFCSLAVLAKVSAGMPLRVPLMVSVAAKVWNSRKDCIMCVYGNHEMYM